uniref:Putative microplusin-like antibacteral peptide n=1 Tax=Rhipicephalus pulchellus TaxID=72859 RepID=L7LQQ6_RHIPC
MKAALVLAIAFVIAYADHQEGTDGHEHGAHEHHHGHGHGHGHHGSVCNFPPAALVTVVECVERNVTDQIRDKLAAVSQRLECDTILCGIQKFCQAHGTLEGNRTDVFTHEENVQLRNAFIGCRPQPVATTEDAAE